MTPVECQIADYISAQLASVSGLSIKQLAQSIQTSEASVLRFCKTLGYKGYRDFALNLSAALGAMEESGQQGRYTDIRPGDELTTIIENIAFNNKCSIEDTLTVLDKKAVEKAVNMLCQAPRINFYGLGASGLVCRDAEQKFMRIDKRCQAFYDGHGIRTAAALLGRQDVAVLVSNSGETTDLVEALDLVRASNANCIVITRYVKSRLAENVDVVLNISTPETTFRSGAMGSRIAMLTIVDMLFAGVASAQYEEIKEFLDKTHDALTSLRGR